MSREEFNELLWITRGGLDPVSLEKCRDEPEDTEDTTQRVQLRAGVLQWLTTLTRDERNKKMCALDHDTLDLLVEVLEENWDDFTKAAGYYKVRGTQVTARVVRGLKALKANKEEFVRVSDYLHVMDIRQQAAARRRPVSNRAVARLLGESESKIRRWDKRANELGVTPEDWDFKRLQQIVKPSKRVPP
jgi:predicted DNA-binding protein (UPF0251 family)